MDETNATTDVVADVPADIPAAPADAVVDNSQPAGEEKPFNFPDVKEEAETVPDKYEFNLPEGLELTAEIETKFTEIAKAAGLTQSQADGLVKMHSDIITDIQHKAEEVKNTWAAECKKQGLSTEVNLRAAKLAVDTFGGGEAMTALVESGVAFNPAVQKMLQNIGHLLEEDTAPDGAHAGKETSAADLLFANSKY